MITQSVSALTILRFWLYEQEKVMGMEIQLDAFKIKAVNCLDIHFKLDV